MSVTPLRGQCANCGADEQLSRIAEGEGACPFCHLPFCDDDELFLRLVLPEPLFRGLVSVPWPEQVTHRA